MRSGGDEYDPVETVVTHIACRVVRMGAASAADLARMMRLYGVDARQREEVERQLRRAGLGLKRAAVLTERPTFEPSVAAQEAELVRCAFTRSPSRRAAVRHLLRRAKRAWRAVLTELFRHREARRVALSEGKIILEQRIDETPATTTIRDEDLAFVAALEEVQIELDEHEHRTERNRRETQPGAPAGETNPTSPGGSNELSSTPHTSKETLSSESAAAPRNPDASQTPDADQLLRVAATLTTYARPRMVVAAWQSARRGTDETISMPSWLTEMGRRMAEFETEREIVAHAFEGLVLALVRRMPGQLRDEADSLSAGLDGIRKAIEYFDIDADYEFPTYALHWVRREMGRRLTGPPTPRLQEVHNELRNELAREPSPTELSWASGAPLGEVCRMLRQAR